MMLPKTQRYKIASNRLFNNRLQNNWTPISINPVSEVTRCPTILTPTSTPINNS